MTIRFALEEFAEASKFIVVGHDCGYYTNTIEPPESEKDREERHPKAAETSCEERFPRACTVSSIFQQKTRGSKVFEHIFLT